MTLSAYQIELVHDALRLLEARWERMDPGNPDAELAQLIVEIEQCDDVYLAPSRPPYLAHGE